VKKGKIKNSNPHTEKEKELKNWGGWIQHQRFSKVKNKTLFIKYVKGEKRTDGTNP